MRCNFDYPTSLDGEPKAHRRGGIGSNLSGLSGDRCERVTGATRNRTTEIPPSDEPLANAVAPSRLLFRSDLQEVGCRSGRAGPGPAATATTFFGSIPPALVASTRVRPVDRTLPWDTVPIHLAERGCQEGGSI